MAKKARFTTVRTIPHWDWREKAKAALEKIEEGTINMLFRTAANSAYSDLSEDRRNKIVRRALDFFHANPKLSWRTRLGKFVRDFIDNLLGMTTQKRPGQRSKRSHHTGRTPIRRPRTRPAFA
jgi:predicted metal-dependent peptidase